MIERMNSPFERGEWRKDGKQTVKHVAGAARYFRDLAARVSAYARAEEGSALTGKPRRQFRSCQIKMLNRGSNRSFLGCDGSALRLGAAENVGANGDDQ
ncbi:hypothetical protein [Sphingomonas sp.]|uniref:hypothetical protein n=1 Tax=Sphingomonas sp. TaxID=28214 RepID=UPI0025DA4B6F|nr:hypothetical protein [Sphingomonas sp.]